MYNSRTKGHTRGTAEARSHSSHSLPPPPPPAAAQSQPRRRPPPGEFRRRIRVPSVPLCPESAPPGAARLVRPGVRCAQWHQSRGARPAAAPPQERAAALHRRTADSRGAPHARRPRAHAAAFRPRLASAECPSDRRLYRWCVTRDPDGAQSRRARDRILARIAGKLTDKLFMNT